MRLKRNLKIPPKVIFWHFKAPHTPSPKNWRPPNFSSTPLSNLNYDWSLIESSLHLVPVQLSLVTPPISNQKKKTGKFPQLNHNSWSLLWMIPSHKEPEWLFWMSDDFKMSNCFYPPVANIWGILMFNLFVCCSTQSTWQQGCHNKISRLCMGEYNK